MRFSLLLQIAIFSLASSTFAAPVLGGKDQHSSQPPNTNPPTGQNPAHAHEAAPQPAPAAAAAGPKTGDIVLVKPANFLDKNFPITGGAPNKQRPAVVVMPADKAGVVGVAPIGHKLPSSHTDDPANYGIPKPPNDDRPHFISTGPPNQIHVDHIKPTTKGDLPTEISHEHLESLKNKIVENMDAVSVAKKQKIEDAKEKKKEKAPAQAPAPGAGLYDDLPAPSSNQGGKDKGKAATAAPAPAPAHGGLYDDLPLPKNPPQSGASGSGAGSSKKRPLERRARLYRRDVDAITGERLSRRLHARSR